VYRSSDFPTDSVVECSQSADALKGHDFSRAANAA
jgi:hypothetical protein